MDGMKYRTVVSDSDEIQGRYCPVRLLLKAIQSNSNPPSFHRHVQHIFFAATPIGDM
jgi:hypothetical protein